MLAGLVAVFACYSTIAHVEAPLLDWYGFRQTQTAMTVYWMMKEGWNLAYQTPVVGYPWSVPFEFPIYQTLTAVISKLGGFPLETTGRLLSFCFLIACAWPACLITRRLGLPRETAWIFCALLWSSPLYLMGGRAFLIETTALFFTLMMIPYALDLRHPDFRWKAVFLFVLFATLGMLQKATTAGPVLLIMGIVVLKEQITNCGTLFLSRRLISRLALAFSLPLMTGLLWLAYTDFIKSGNILAVLQTSAALTKWNFGTEAERLNLHLWNVIFWDRAIYENAGGIFGPALLAGAFIGSGHRIRAMLSVSLVLFALPILIFLNLHASHYYYQIACLVFLTGAMAIALAAWVPRLGWYPLFPLITLIIVLWNLTVFVQRYSPVLQQNITASNSVYMAVGDVIRRYTPPDSAIAVFGQDGNTAIAYYARRKAVEPSLSHNIETYNSIWADPKRYLGGLPLSAVVFCPSDLIREDIRMQPDVALHPALFDVHDCYINLPGIKSIVVDGGARTIHPGVALDALLTSPPGGYPHTVHGACAGYIIDNINGDSLLPDPRGGGLQVMDNALNNGQRLRLQGLLLIGVLLVNDARMPDDLFLTFQPAHGAPFYVPLRAGSRSGVYVLSGPLGASIKDFNESFRAAVDVRTLKGSYTLSLALGQKDTLRFCDDSAVRLTIVSR
jgi:hypothetical protein